jgi:hypothetical protein
MSDERLDCPVVEEIQVISKDDDLGFTIKLNVSTLWVKWEFSSDRFME